MVMDGKSSEKIVNSFKEFGLVCWDCVCVVEGIIL